MPFGRQSPSRFPTAVRVSAAVLPVRTPAGLLRVLPSTSGRLLLGEHQCSAVMGRWALLFPGEGSRPQSLWSDVSAAAEASRRLRVCVCVVRPSLLSTHLRVQGRLCGQHALGPDRLSPGSLRLVTGVFIPSHSPSSTPLESYLRLMFVFCCVRCDLFSSSPLFLR